MECMRARTAGPRIQNVFKLFQDSLPFFRRSLGASVGVGVGRECLIFSLALMLDFKQFST